MVTKTNRRRTTSNGFANMYVFVWIVDSCWRVWVVMQTRMVTRWSLVYCMWLAQHGVLIVCYFWSEARAWREWLTRRRHLPHPLREERFCRHHHQLRPAHHRRFQNLPKIRSMSVMCKEKPNPLNLSYPNHSLSHAQSLITHPLKPTLISSWFAGLSVEDW